MAKENQPQDRLGSQYHGDRRISRPIPTVRPEAAKNYETWKDSFWKPPPAEIKVMSTDRLFKYADYEPPEEFCRRAHMRYAIR